MPLDHFHNESRYAPHTNDTFQQQYWVDTSSYVDGGPVIIHAMGEDPSSYDLQWLQSGLPHQIANATGGVAVLWGQRSVSCLLPNPLPSPNQVQSSIAACHHSPFGEKNHSGLTFS